MDIPAELKKFISIDLIKKVVCENENIAIEALDLKTRKREIVQARQRCMYFAKEITKLSLASIGSQVGGKDHATVLHAHTTVNNFIDTDKAYSIEIDDISKEIIKEVKDSSLQYRLNSVTITRDEILNDIRNQLFHMMLRKYPQSKKLAKAVMNSILSTVDRMHTGNVGHTRNQLRTIADNIKQLT